MGTAGQLLWQRLCIAIGREDLLSRREFARELDRATNRIALNEAVNEALQERTSGEWIDILNKAGVPCGPIYSIDQVFADPQVQHLQAAAPVRHPVLGEIRLVNQAVGLGRTPASIARAAPDPGAHTDEVLGEIGYAQADIAALRTRGVI